ncbi:hypothetical protein N7475_000312 [Penicillium sp. IBT 31633x]|nr:hypothetical protein N7475_000202 [Penicillium sp. IBT 31633x]KAJ5481500.1 hypothetical protein N7475_000312 [Penicillium sp. IBT 31633x]
MASNSGITKSSATKGNRSHLPEMQERAENGLMPPALAKRAADQANVLEGPPPKNNSSDTNYGAVLNDDGAIDQANSPQPPHSPVVDSIERDDTPMHDAGPAHQAGAGSSSGGHERAHVADHPQDRNVPSVSFRHTTDSEDPELLATLESSNDDEEDDAIVDGWGTLRGSTFVILRYGPRGGSRYKFKYRQGYTNGHINHISQGLRIPQLQVGSASKTWRYTKHNVVGICGVVSEERNNPKKRYKSDPCTWLKIKWKDLRPEDLQKLPDSYSWIPRSDFVRFCNGKRAANAKIKEVWDRQEDRYQRFLLSDTERDSADRSPTPCPLGSAARQSLEREHTQRPDSPATRFLSADQYETPSLVNAQMPPRQGSSTNPINLDGDEASRNPVFSDAALNSNTNAAQNKSLPANGPRAIRTEAEFIAGWKEKKGWENLDSNQREACLTVAQAMYDLYKDTITENQPSRGSVDFPIGQRPGVAIAAH